MSDRLTKVFTAPTLTSGSFAPIFSPPPNSTDYFSRNKDQLSPSTGEPFAYYRLDNTFGESKPNYYYIQGDFGTLCSNFNTAITHGVGASTEWSWVQSLYNDIIDRRTNDEWHICEEMCIQSPWGSNFTAQTIGSFLTPRADRALDITCSTPNPAVCETIASVGPRYVYFDNNNTKDGEGPQAYKSLLCSWATSDFQNTATAKLFYNTVVKDKDTSPEGTFWVQKIMPGFCSGSSTTCSGAARCSMFASTGDEGVICRAWKAGVPGYGDYSGLVQTAESAFCLISGNSTLAECTSGGGGAEGDEATAEAAAAAAKKAEDDAAAAAAAAKNASDAAAAAAAAAAAKKASDDAAAAAAAAKNASDAAAAAAAASGNAETTAAAAAAKKASDDAAAAAAAAKKSSDDAEKDAGGGGTQTSEGLPGWATAVIVIVVFVVIGVGIGLAVYFGRKNYSRGGTPGMSFGQTSPRPSSLPSVSAPSSLPTRAF